MAQKQITLHDTNTSTVMFDTAGYETIVISARGLAGAEEVPISIVVGGTALPITDTSGAAQKLTATIIALELAGGPVYSFVKPATASAASLYVDLPTER